MKDNNSEKLPGDLERIAQITGIDAALKIAFEFRGTTLYIPNLDEFIREARNEKIKRAFDSGIPVKSIALKFKVSERAVRNILSMPDRPIGEIVMRLIEVV